MGTGSIAHHHARRVEHKETKPGEAVNASRRASSESSRWKTQDWSTPIHNYQFQPVFFMTILWHSSNRSRAGIQARTVPCWYPHMDVRWTYRQQSDIGHPGSKCPRLANTRKHQGLAACSLMGSATGSLMRTEWPSIRVPHRQTWRQSSQEDYERRRAQRSHPQAAAFLTLSALHQPLVAKFIVRACDIKT